MRDILSLNDDEFLHVVNDFEHDDIEKKRNLSFETDGAKADFGALVGGLANTGGGTIVVGPYQPITAVEERRFDPANLANILESVLSGRVRIRVSRRDIGPGTFVLVVISPPTEVPYVFARTVGPYTAGTLPLRDGTRSRVVTDSQEMSEVWRRFLKVEPSKKVRDLRAAYAGRSADLSLETGQVGVFTVFYANIGTHVWRLGTESEALLAQSLFEPALPELPSVSAQIFTKQTQSVVAPGQIATFTFQVRVPLAAVGPLMFFVHPEVGRSQIGVDVQFTVYLPRPSS